MKRIVCMIIVLLIVCFSIAGCKEKNTGKENAEAVISDFLTKYQQKDKTATSYLINEGLESEITYNGVQAIIAESITFEIKDTESFKDGYLVDVIINVLDFKSAFETISKNANDSDSEEDILNSLTKLLKSENAPEKEFCFRAIVVAEKDSMKIQMTSEFYNALSGGYHEYIDSILEEMTNG